MNLRTGEIVNDVGLREISLSDILSPYSWVDFQAVVDSVMLESGHDPAEWPLYRIVSTYTTLQQRAQTQGNRQLTR